MMTEDLWKTYDMGEAIAVHALSGVTFEIDRGEYVAVVGRRAPASPP